MISNLLSRPKNIEDKIVKLVKEVIPSRHAKGAKIDRDTALADLGVDSMGKVSLAFRIEEVLDVDLSQYAGNIAEFRTIGDVVSFVQEIRDSK